MGIEKRSKEEILSDPNVHVVMIHPKSYLMADWAIEAMEAGKAVLCEETLNVEIDRWT
jgi:predicted dehydrogenase